MKEKGARNRKKKVPLFGKSRGEEAGEIQGNRLVSTIILFYLLLPYLTSTSIIDIFLSYSLLEKTDWQLSDLIVYEFHWKRLINKDECDGRTCMFIVCLTSTHLNLEILSKRRILVLRTATSSLLRLRFRYLGKFDAVLRFSLGYQVRYCGIRTSLTPPSFYEKILWIEVWRNFFRTLLIVTLVTEGLLSPFLCRPFTTLKIKSLAFMFCRKITICFCLFYIPWTRQITHEIWARFYVVCLFFCFSFIS